LVQLIECAEVFSLGNEDILVVVQSQRVRFIFQPSSGEPRNRERTIAPQRKHTPFLVCETVNTFGSEQFIARIKQAIKLDTRGNYLTVFMLCENIGQPFLRAA
jgi:hypothetical protein